MSDKKLLIDFIQEYGGELMSFALSLVKNRPEAEDACQEMLVQMLKHWEDFDGSKSLKSWAFTILYRKCLDQLKKRRRFLNFFRRATADYSAALEERTGNRLEESISDSALSQLRPAERTCLFLWAREGYSSEEIAGIMGCSPGTVRVHLFQARRKLKKLMEKGNEKKASVSSG